MATGTHSSNKNSPICECCSQFRAMTYASCRGMPFKPRTLCIHSKFSNGKSRWEKKSKTYILIINQQNLKATRTIWHCLDLQIGQFELRTYIQCILVNVLTLRLGGKIGSWVGSNGMKLLESNSV